MKIINPFDNREIKYKIGWKSKLLDMWMFTKLLNLDLKGTTYESREKWIKKFGLDKTVGDFEMTKHFRFGKIQHTKVCIMLDDEGMDIDTVSKFKDLIERVEEYMKDYDKLELEFGWETWDLEGSGYSSNAYIVK